MPKRTSQAERKPSAFINALRSFVRKERFFVIKAVMRGQSTREITLTLSQRFRRLLVQFTHFKVPADAFVAVEYNLDWLHASLALANSIYATGMPFVNHDADGNQIVTGTQQDVDVLVAFTDDNVDYLILIEAKGYMKWEKNQMIKKTRRIAQILKQYPTVKFYFIVLSPHLPHPDRELMTAEWPQMVTSKLSWIEMAVPPDQCRVIRCNSEGERDENGSYFKVEFEAGNDDEYDPEIIC